MHLQPTLEQTGSSSQDAAIMDSLKEKLKEILSSFDTTKRVVLYDYPRHLNVGDLLIQMGTEQFLAENNIDVWRRYSVYDMPDSIRGMDDDVVILCHGGGNFGDLWPHHHNGRERVLGLYPRNRIVVLPQTVYFESRDRSCHSMERFCSHGNCHIFARDKRSLETLQRAGVHHSSAMPDMAQYLWRNLLVDESSGCEMQPMRIVRRDKESRAYAVLQGDGYTAQVCDWPNILGLSTSRLARLATTAIQIQCDLGLRAQKHWQWRPIQDRAIRDGIRFFSRYREIYSNRLHGMILGLLLGRKVCAFDNSYGKLSSYRNTWLDGMESLTWEPEE
jgi:pyruvyl transferase EpsO